jgi:hypothetical protein
MTRESELEFNCTSKQSNGDLMAVWDHYRLQLCPSQTTFPLCFTVNILRLLDLLTLFLVVILVDTKLIHPNAYPAIAFTIFLQEINRDLAG